MRVILKIIVLSMISVIFTQKFTLAQSLFNGSVNNKDSPSLILYSGMKLPETSGETQFGFWVGFTLDVPLGLNWSIGPDANYWKAEIKNMKNVHILGISLLITHTFKSKNFSLRLAAGPGIGNESSPFGQKAKTIILINLEGNSFIILSKQISIVPKIRYQIAARLSTTSSGNLFTPFLIGLGIQYKLLNN